MADDETIGDPPDDSNPVPRQNLRKFPYHDVYKVRNMLFSMDIPVFTALAEDSDQETHRFNAVFCFN